MCSPDYPLKPFAETRTHKSLDFADLLARLVITILGSLLSEPLKKAIRRVSEIPHKGFLLWSAVSVAGYVLVLLGGDVEYIYLTGMIGFLILFVGMFFAGKTQEARSIARRVETSRPMKIYEYELTRIDRAYLSKPISILTLPVLIKLAWDNMLSFALKSGISYDPGAHAVYLIFMMVLMLSSILWLRSVYLFLSREWRNLKRHLSQPNSN